jgi:chromate transporter
MRAVAVGAFVALYLFGAPFPLVVATAALIGVVAAKPRAGAAPSANPARGRPSWRRSVRILVVGAVLWSAPVALCAVVFGRSSVLAQESVFFAGTSMITFGGAYAVLSFVAQRAVVHYGWLSAGEMVQGLALAETTPGPLILVLQFVAFVAAYRAPGDLPPWVAAVLGATVAMWVTFLPSFTFVLAGAPYIEAMHDESRITAAMRGVSASVVGVIANLSVFFAVHTFFASTRVHRFGPIRVEVPQWSSVRPVALVVAAVASVLLFRVRLGTLRLLAVCAALGAAGHLLTQ